MAQSGVAAEARQHLADSGNVGAGVKQVLAAIDEGGFMLLTDNLKAILLADGVMDKPVIVISVAGAFRKGKSFLLDMMMRYLTAHNKSNWVNEPATKIFPWRSGFERHTTGILMSQPIPVTLPDGTEAVILLMDTQGTFDSQSTAHESSTVFALSTLLSSLQIFNVTQQLQNNDLEHLQLFTEYGRMALDDTDGTKPFQKLLFLVRDWQNADELPLGAEGGDRLVKKWLGTPARKSELEQVRDHIRDCFSDINGFLLPHPGMKVAGDRNFGGNSADMDPMFVTQLEELMPKLLAPENLTVKTIAGNPVTAGDLYMCFDLYTKLFSSGDLPKAKTIVQATAEANNMAAVQVAKTQYQNELVERIIHGEEPSLVQDQLSKKHHEAKERAIKTFSDQKKMGDSKTSERFCKTLLKEIEELFRKAKKANEEKRKIERAIAEKHNGDLVDTCKAAYKRHMDQVAGKNDTYVDLKEMHSEHERARRKAMDHFDTQKKTIDGVEKDGCKLSGKIDDEFLRVQFHNDMKKDEINRKAAQANNKAAIEAKQAYETKMSELLSSENALTDKDLQTQHEVAMKAAVEKFESLRDSDKKIAAGYLENLKRDIDHDKQSYIRDNKHKAEINRFQTQMKEMSEEVKEAQKGFFTKAWESLHRGLTWIYDAYEESQRKVVEYNLKVLEAGGIPYQDNWD